ncbi:TAG lipase / lysophosphatidylethanolamine acyltransferase, partial [Lecanoromycetidae sp. Uapishka_2]
MYAPSYTCSLPFCTDTHLLPQKTYNWLNKKPPLNTLLARLSNAQSYEEWSTTAFVLDELLHTDLWRQNASSKYYDYRLMNERRLAIINAREEEDILGLVNLLRSGLVRNLGNITTPKLFNRAYAGTKLLIEEYVTQVALAVEYVTALPTGKDSAGESGWTSQAKLDLLHDTRQAFGRSTLVLQGGAMFGLCHLGVVKALHLRGLLPRIITGTATGALIAALVGIHTEDELLDFLNGDGIDLTAFARNNGEIQEDSEDEKKGLVQDEQTGKVQTSLRRLRRFVREGHFLDVNILEECVRANVGDLTFEEAYARTKRVLNITIATSNRGGVPNLLNYLTAPNVLIWSAALASNASTTANHMPHPLLCKDETGAIVPWLDLTSPQNQIQFYNWRTNNYTTNERDSPLSRIAELFNVNHFVVSQARPYIAPFLRSDLQHPDNPRQARRTGIVAPVLRLVTLEVHHRLSQLDSLGLLPTPVRRLLIDETVPGASLTLVPDLTPSDFLKLLETPTKESLDYWILHGERSVWPAISALKVRCAIEVELDRCYQMVRRRKPMDFGSPVRMRSANSSMGGGNGNGNGNVGMRRRDRASSVGMG